MTQKNHQSFDTPNFQVLLRLLTLSLLAMFLPQSASAQKSEVKKANERPIARVFILAGQSNMAGHGVVDLDDEQDYNGGLGTLVDVIKKSTDKNQYGHLRNEDGTWVVRDDVWIRYDASAIDQVKTGGLSIGFTNRGDKHHIGPEFQFGHVVGQAFEEPVLLIKTAWGGKSLFKDFRPPSSSRDFEKHEVGPVYIMMLEQIAAALENVETEFPALQDHELVISGFVWQQGWNDMIDDVATAEYETNLLNFITDFRRQIGIPELPFVVGELGNGGETQVSKKMEAFRKAQAAIANYGDPNVAFVPTTQFARPADLSPNKTHLHHWSGNAESYFLIGDALGKAMVGLVNGKSNDAEGQGSALKKPRVLILGDSISIGYTPFV
jgi:hypothetical protein